MDEDAYEFLEDDMVDEARLQWTDAPMLLFGGLADLLDAASNICHNVSRTFMLHGNYQANRIEMRDQFHMELESLPVTEDGDER